VENREIARYCAECGVRLTRLCAACGGGLPPNALFCDVCGARVEPAAPAGGRTAATDLSSASPAAAERRQVTVLFCDVVDSMPLSARLDPEDYRNVIGAYQNACAAIVAGLEGHVAQYLGDGVLVFFGFPKAHEDDAQRAVLAAMRIVQAAESLNPRLREECGVELALRAGVHTGVVVAGEVGAGSTREQLVLGEVPNVAARLQHVAPVNAVAVSATTQSMTRGYFAWEDLGEQTLNGIAQPLHVYRPVAQSAARTRLEALGPNILSPLVGREADLALLLERWSQAREGRGQVVMLVGEPGIGKSRLVQALREDVARDARAWLTPMQCSPYHRQSAFHPVVEMYERVVFRFAPADAPSQKLRALEGWLAQYGQPLPELVPIFAALMGIPLDERYAESPLLAEQQRQRLLQTMQAIILQVAASQPLLLTVEDLHWADPTTLDLLAQVVDQVPTARILAVFTARPEFVAPWGRRTHVAEVTLPRLVAQQVSQLAYHVAAKALPPAVLQQIVAKTDGVPLFVEELTKMVVESGMLRSLEDRYELDGPLSPLAIPATVQDSLLARLDRLERGRAQAQLAACIGREFPYPLLRAVSPWDETTLHNGLDRLVDAELLYRRGSPPDVAYAFKHALVQDAAYQSLLRSTRQQYHARIAQAQVEQFPADAQARPEVVAHHYSQAALAQEAVTWWLRAAQQAHTQFANAEAASHAREGLAQLENLPDTDDRARIELALQTTLGIALLTTKGYGAAEVGAAYERANELARELDADLAPITWGRCVNALVRGDLHACYALAKELVRSTAADDPVRLVAYRMLGYPQLLWGDPAAARDHAERARELYDPLRHHALATYYGQDPGVAARACGALAWWTLGYPDTARARADEGLALERQQPHPHTRMQLLMHCAILHQLRHDAASVQRFADECLAAATPYANVYWQGQSHAMLGWARAAEGDATTGLAMMRRGITEIRSTGVGIFLAYLASMLAEACIRAGARDEALAVLTAAVERPEKPEDRFALSELYRLRAEVFTERDESSKAAADLQRAVVIAREQQAKLLELRAALSLARLWQRAGAQGEARKLLEPLYASFTEGFNEADLVAARDLLAALGKPTESYLSGSSLQA
jgi:class 3 adenylate cyclase/predicted ATPase